MENEVHIFLAKAIAEDGNDLGYPVGEKHAMMLYLSQGKGTAHDWETAEKIINESSWNNVEFSKAGTLNYENVKEKDEVFIGCYEEALSNGSAILVYSGIEE